MKEPRLRTAAADVYPKSDLDPENLTLAPIKDFRVPVTSWL